MPFLDNLPYEVITKIFAEVEYNGRDGRQLRRVCKKFEQILADEAVPRMIAKAQYRSFYLIEEILHPKETFGWSDLNNLYNKSQVYLEWHELLPQENTDIVATTFALINCVHEIKKATQTLPSSLEERIFLSALNFVRLARDVLPIEALILVRYISILTDEALQLRHYQNPADDFALSTMGQTEVAANTFCRFILFEASILAKRSAANQLISKLNNTGEKYDSDLRFARILRTQLEIGDPHLRGIGAMFMLYFVIDKILKEHFLKEAGEGTQGYVTSVDNSEHSADNQTIRTKFVRAYDTHLDVNRRIRAIFQSEQAAKGIYHAIDEKTIAQRMLIHLTKVGTMQGDEMEDAVDEELEALELDDWPYSTYLNF